MIREIKRNKIYALMRARIIMIVKTEDAVQGQHFRYLLLDKRQYSNLRDLYNHWLVKIFHPQKC